MLTKRLIIAVAAGALVQSSRIGLQLAGAQTGALIGAWTKTAAPGETMLLSGQGLDTGEVMVGDGVDVGPARVLDSSHGATLRNSTRLMAVVPESMRPGTLWVWLENAGTRSSNTVALNAPEPWWIQPDRIDKGQRTRIFGRNLDSGYLAAGSAVAVKLVGATGASFLSGTLVRPNVIELSVAADAQLAYGDYEVYIKEVKNDDFYGPLRLTLAPRRMRSSYTVNVTRFGATADDDTADNQAFIAATDHVIARGGGTIEIPAGVFLFDESVIGDSAQGSILPGAEARHEGGELHYRGAARDETILRFAFADKPSKSHDKIALYGGSSLEDLSVEVVGDKYYPEDRTIAIDGNHCTLRNIHLDQNLCKVYQAPVDVRGEYVTIEDVAIQGAGPIRFHGRQIRIANILHRGPMPQSHYPEQDQDDLNFAPQLFATWGVKELVFENNRAEDQWDQYRGAHFKRFFGPHSHWGGVHHAYLAGNMVSGIKSQPFNNAGECMLFEGSITFYTGRAQIHAHDPQAVNLLDSGMVLDETLFSRDAVPQRVPMLVVIVSGGGAGQTRLGWPRDAATLEIDQPFIVPPDDTSVVVVLWAFSENIVAENTLTADNLYATASAGIQFFAAGLNNIVRDNRMAGFHLGYSDWIFDESREQPFYFNEVCGNEIVGALGGIVTNVYDGQKVWLNALGNLYRQNTIRHMDCGLPQFRTRGYYSALGIVPWSVRYRDLVGAEPQAAIGYIYERNNVDSSRHAFLVDKAVADWVVVRENHLGDAKLSAVEIDEAVTHVTESNSANSLPRIHLVDATDPYRTTFELPWTTWIDAPSHCAAYVWSRDGAGSLAVEVTDEDGDQITGVSIEAAPGIEMDDRTVFWHGLRDGLHVVEARAGDGRGVGTRTVYLFVGAYDDFEEITSVGGNGGTAGGQLFTVHSESASYTSAVTELFNGAGGNWPHYHRVEPKTDPPFGTQLAVWPINEEVSLRGSGDGTASSRAVLSFVKNHYTAAGSYVKLRLKQDETTYYEFYDHVNIPTRFETRKITKVVDGAVVAMVEAFAAHEWESPIIMEKQDSIIRVTGWGDSMEMHDAQPLDISGWEILLASSAVGHDSFFEEYAYATLDNLFFVSGDDIATSISVPAP